MLAFRGPRLGRGLLRTASIALVAPLFISVLSGPVLHERVEGRTWVALAFGFGGVLLIVRPGGGLFTWVSVLPLASAFMMAVYQLMTRRLAGSPRALPRTAVGPRLAVAGMLLITASGLALAVSHRR